MLRHSPKGKVGWSHSPRILGIKALTNAELSSGFEATRAEQKHHKVSRRSIVLLASTLMSAPIKLFAAKLASLRLILPLSEYGLGQIASGSNSHACW